MWGVDLCYLASQPDLQSLKRKHKLSFMESKGYRKLNLNHKSQLLYFFFPLFFFSVCLLVSITGTATTCQQDFRFLLFAQAAGDICSQVSHFTAPFIRVLLLHMNYQLTGIQLSQEIPQKNQVPIPVDNQVHPLSLARRFLSGPGSSPPRCVSKCGNCAPCKPVHVSVPPGTPVTAEYYPEAWRCKCGNKLYMP
ncbi:hypothetical protein V6N13_058908 [Hibiscus sabdariffa]